jgi:hypothetical protein
VIERLRAIGNAAAEASIGWLTFFADTYRTVYGFEGPPVSRARWRSHDPSSCAASTRSSRSRPRRWTRRHVVDSTAGEAPGKRSRWSSTPCRPRGGGDRAVIAVVGPINLTRW